jgi:hypothetical protein
MFVCAAWPIELRIISTMAQTTSSRKSYVLSRPPPPHPIMCCCHCRCYFLTTTLEERSAERERQRRVLAGLPRATATAAYLIPGFNHRRIPSAADATHVTSLLCCPVAPSLPSALPPMSASVTYHLAVDGSFSTSSFPALAAVFDELTAAVTYVTALVPRPPLVLWLTSSRIFCDLVEHGSLLPGFNSAVLDLLTVCAASNTVFTLVFSPVLPRGRNFGRRTQKGPYKNLCGRKNWRPNFL